MPDSLPPSQPAVPAHAPGKVLPFPTAADAQAAQASPAVELPSLPLPAEWLDQSTQTRALRMLAAYFLGANEPFLARVCQQAADAHDLMRLALVDYVDADDALRAPPPDSATYALAIDRVLMARANARSVAELAMRGVQ